MPSFLSLLPTTSACLLLLGFRSIQASKPSVAVITPRDPESLRSNHPGIFATFSGYDMPKQDLAILVPKDGLGCDPDQGSSTSSDFVLVVLRGNCTFTHKAAVAQRAGAKGLIIISDSQDVPIMSGPNGTQKEEMSIFVLGVDQKFGAQLTTAALAAKDAGEGPLMMAVKGYEPSLLNISEGILICLATFLVALGAVFSTSDLDVHKQGSLIAAVRPAEDEVADVDYVLALGFFVIGSCALVLLFFFMKYLIYFIIFSFCIGGASCITQFGAVALVHFFPPSKNTAKTLPFFGPVSWADIMAGIVAGIVVISWVVLRNTPYGWPFQDIIGSCFLCSLQRTIRLPNAQVATVLLSAMFFFDIFWVFISPVFFHQSVMVSVATGGGTGESVPMLLRIPALGDAFGNDRLLGFGDIALPGLLISFLLRHDFRSGRSLKGGYFAPALVGYFVGLILTIGALCIMRMGQPALLYLVPCTLGTTLVIAKCRGEIGNLWTGVPVKTEVSHARNGDGV